MSKTAFRFTKAALEAIIPPEKGHCRYRDDKTPGLALRVTAGGAKTFVLSKRVHGRPQDIRIGPFPALTIDQARNKAAEYNGQIAMGDDPAAKKREDRHASTFGELFDWYIAQPKKSGDRGERTVIEYRKLVNGYLGGLVKKKPGEIKPRDVEAIFDRIGKENGRYAANRTLALVKAVFNRAIRKGLIKGASPAAGIEPFPETSRDRRLMPHEIEKFIAAVVEDESETVRDYVLMSLYTGVRKANMLAARWDQISFEASAWRIPLTKNGTSQDIPLLDAELDILRRRLAQAKADAAAKAAKGDDQAIISPWVFPSTSASGHLADPKAGWRRILERAGIEDFRIHDLRRSLASLMVDGGTSLAVIGKTLNHKSQVTTAVYARLSQNPVIEAKRAAHAVIRGAGRGEVAE